MSQRLVFVFLVGTATVAFAQAFPTVAPFPLELKRVPAGFATKDAKALTTDFERLVRKAGADVPDSALFATALKDLKRQDCDRDDECLKQLAQLSHTLYALFVVLDVTLDGTVTATGRVVRSDGKAMGPSKMVELPKTKERFGDVARTAISRLLDELGVRELPLQRTVQLDAPKDLAPKPIDPPPPAEPKPTPLVETPKVAVERRTGLRSFALIPLIVAGAAGVGAGVTYGLATSIHRRLLEASWGEGTDPAGAARTGQSLQLVAAVSTGVAAAAAVTALIFFLTGSSESVSAGTSGPVAGTFTW